MEDHRVAIYDPVLVAPPDGLPFATIGTTTLGCTAGQLNIPRAAFVTPLGQVVVADTNNNRVLIWESIGDGGPLGPATVVLGQTTKDTCKPNDFNGDGTPESTPRAETLNGPSAVWSDGVQLIVADRNNHRVLIWDTFPTRDFQAPKYVLGQPNFLTNQPNAGLATPTASTFSGPMSIDVSHTGELAVVDRSNNRVLIWDAIPSGDTQAADQVIGQPDMVSGRARPTSGKTLSGVSGVRFDGRNMIVTDSSNNRVVVFRALD